MAERGLEVSSSKRRLRRTEQEVGTDKRTGEVVTRPATEFRMGRGRTAIRMTPDPGWNYNPGAVSIDPSQLPPLTIPPPVAGQPGWVEARLPAVLPRSVKGVAELPKVKGPDAQRKVVQQVLADQKVEPISITRLDGKEDTLYHRVPTPADLDDVWLTASLIEHAVVGKPREHRERWANFVIPTLRDPGEVWFQEQKIGDRLVYREVYLASYPDDDILVVAQQEKQGMLAWTYFRISSKKGALNSKRVGKLLYRKPEEKGD